MDLNRVLGLLRRGWLAMVLAVVAGAGLGFGQYQLTSPLYSANATLLFTLSSRGSFSVLAEGSTYVQDLMPSYIKVIDTPLVLQPVIDQLGLHTSARTLAGRITVSSELNSVIAKISVHDSDPDRAAGIANAVADQTKIAVAGLAPKGATQLGQVAVASIARAVPASSPFAPKLLSTLLRGLLLGLGLAIAGIVLWDVVVSAGVSNRAAVARATVAPVLGMITLDPKSRQRPLPIVTQPLLPRSESFRFVHANLAALAEGSKLCLVVTSAGRDEGRTTTAANLAITIGLSHAGQRVLLIDADLREPMMAELMNVESALGLTSVVTGKVTLEEAIVEWSTNDVQDQKISFLPAGPAVSEPGDLLASKAMALLLKRVRSLYDVVILDSAPLLSVTDGAILAAQADGAIVVVDAQKTRHRKFSESLNRMRLAGAEVLGVVLNRMTDVSHEYKDLKSARHDVAVGTAYPEQIAPKVRRSAAVNGEPLGPTVPSQALLGAEPRPAKLPPAPANKSS